MTRSYTGRLAPSPTGLLHLGHAATFLVAGERAAAAGGRLLLRFDDLDPQRSRPRFVQAAREDLEWLGLHWEAEIFQSQRMDLYRAAVARLLAMGAVYPCVCSRRDLQEATQAPHEDDDEPLYNGRCRPAAGTLPQTPQLAGVNLRFRVPDGATVRFDDGHCGPQAFVAGQDFGDFLVWRRDGLPSYQLATVVDDAAMGITEVVRGRDLLRSTARQIALQQVLGLATPAYFHTALWRDAEGRRLAKRDAALSLHTLRDEGVSPADVRARIHAFLHHTGS